MTSRQLLERSVVNAELPKFTTSDAAIIPDYGFRIYDFPEEKPSEWTHIMHSKSLQRYFVRLKLATPLFMTDVLSDFFILPVRTWRKAVGERMAERVGIDISGVFEDRLVRMIDEGKAATKIMKEKELRAYKSNPNLFDALANEMLQQLLGDMLSRTSRGLRAKLTEWLRFAAVRISQHIED